MTLRVAANIAAACVLSARCATGPSPLLSAGPVVTPSGSAVAATQSPNPPASASPGPSPSPAVSPGTPAPSNFVATVNNRWFPLLPGTTLRYQGVKDGEKAVDTFEVTSDTEVVAGVTCVVVRDTLTLGGVLAEKTTDWYAQDRLGNVWYFGEDTAEYNEDGTVASTEGSWRTGVDGAEAGIFMPADPKVGDSFAQEHYLGQAEDHFVVLLLGTTVKVPYGSIKGALLTLEWTPLEPDVLSEKFYAMGIGTVKEFDVAGGDEKLELVSVALP